MKAANWFCMSVPGLFPSRAGRAISLQDPSTFLHEVRPVRSGERLVSITFIESRVPDEQDRNTLFELWDVLSLEGLKMDWLSRVRMSVALENLTRRWSKP